MQYISLCLLACISLFSQFLFLPETASSAIITVVNLDGANEGFNDSSPPNAASIGGGNAGATLGSQRLIAFQYAANIWARLVSSSVEIKIDATLDPLTCSSTSAVLGAAGTQTVHRNFSGAPLLNTWYSQALANSLAGADLDPSTSDIGATFNSAIGTTCSFPLVWYYGLDGQPPAGTLDFVSVVLHELGHGLGFQSFVNLATGAKLGGFNDVFSYNLENHSTGKLYSQMTDAERVTASQNTSNLHWVGANVIAASSMLTAGVGSSGHVQMYAPNPQQSGSSVSHFDTAVTPNELMEPFYTGAIEDVGLTLPLLADVGWLITSPPATPNDFDGDGRADEVVYRNGAWFIKRSSDGGSTVVGWGGVVQDVPVAADYDGDGKNDVAVYRVGAWFILNSSGGSTVVGWGGAAQDIAVPADYDGDGKSDVAVFRDGAWFILKSSGGNTVVGWGAAGDIPVPGDYDGDGRADEAVYRNGAWFIKRSTDGGMTVVGWGGAAQDLPVPADYDGDGKTDVAIYRNGAWFILKSSGGTQVLGWGGTVGDVPVPADYDGDGLTDVAIYRSGAWFIRRSSDSGMTVMGWGAAGDVPIN